MEGTTKMRSITTLRKTALCAVAATAVTLASCSGGGGASTALPRPTATPIAPAATQNRATQSMPGSLSVKITIDGAVDKTTQLIARKRAASSQRSAQFVSPSTLGVAVAVAPSGGGAATTTTIDASPGSPSCTPGTPRTCTITLVVTPGAFSFQLKTFDQAPVAGAISGTANMLGVATVPSQTIVANQANTVNFFVDGQVAGLNLSGGTNYSSFPSDGVTHSFAVLLIASDADGNAITATSTTPYANPVSVALAEAGGSGHSTLVLNGANVGTTATVAHSTDTLAVQYDGGGAPGYTTSTTFGATGSTSSTLTISPLYVAGAAVTANTISFAGTAAPTVAPLTATEANAPGVVAYAQALSPGCSTFASSSGSGSGASAALSVTDNVAPFAVSGCSMIVSDNLGSSLTLPIVLPTPLQGCSSAPLGVQIIPTTVSNGAPCTLTVTPNAITVFVAPGNPSTLSFSAGEPNDTGAISIDESQCSGKATFSATSIAGAPTLAGTASGTISVTAVAGNTTCSVTVSDGHGQSSIVAITVDPSNGGAVGPPPCTPDALGFCVASTASFLTPGQCSIQGGTVQTFGPAPSGVIKFFIFNNADQSITEYDETLTNTGVCADNFSTWVPAEPSFALSDPNLP